ncbi:MAG: hypothetical protein JOZ15_11350 [Acidobacteria bacterium]|nr:hypothetical protein [Acidobacteriota bacterium]
MDPRTHHARLSALLRASLSLGALYDAAFAALMVAAPGLPARLLRLPLPPLPEGAFYLWIMAVLLLMLATLYLLAAGDPGRYAGVVAVAALGRILGGLAFLAAARGHPGLAGLYPLAAADLGLGLTHAVCWWPIRS